MVAILTTAVVLTTILSIAARRHNSSSGAVYGAKPSNGVGFSGLLTLVGIAALLYRLAAATLIVKLPGAGIMLAMLGALLVVGLVVFRSLVQVFVALVGFGLLLLGVGLAGALELAVVVALLAWLLGAVRRLTP